MSEIGYIFIRGDQELRCTTEPLELRYDGKSGLFQALVAGESTAEKTDEEGFFLYFGALRYCLRTPEGPVVGFQVIDFLSFEPEQFADATFGPRFSVPQMGLDRAYVGDIIYAAQRAIQAESN